MLAISLCSSSIQMPAAASEPVQEVTGEDQQEIMYNVYLNEVTVSEFAEKNGKITVRAHIATDPYTPDGVTALKINGTEYPLTRVQDDVYTAEIPSGDQLGKQPVDVEAIIVKQKVYKIFWMNESEVLKDAPKVEPSGWTEHDDGTLEFGFGVKDSDNALISGSRVVVTKADQVVAEAEVKAGTNTISFPAESSTQYKVSVQLSYDRDSSRNNNKNEVSREEVYTSQKLTKGVSYAVALQEPSVSEFVEKKENITLSTGIQVTPEAEATAIKVNGQAYTLTKGQDQRYQIQVPGSSSAGSVAVHVASVTVKGKEYPLTWSGTSEVLKDVPKAEPSGWTEHADGTLSFGVTIKDADQALMETSRIVLTKEGQQVKEVALKAGANQITCSPEAGKEYKVSVQLSYDRDGDPDNGENKVDRTECYTDTRMVQAAEPETPAEPEVPADPGSGELLELKNITSVTLYHQGEEVRGLDISQGAPANPEDYLVKIESDTARDLYVEVEDLIKEGNRLRVVPKLSAFLHYEVEDGQVEAKENLLLYADNVVCGVTSIQELIGQMNSNPSGHYVLEGDLDASSLTASYGVSYFDGTLDGNGYTIYNLNVPLFEDLYGATVQNLTIKDARIEGKSGILAANINRSSVENVSIVDSVIDAPDLTTVGGMAGYVYYDSTVKNCRIEHVDIKASRIIGGLAGQTEKGAVIEGVCVSGSLEGTYQGSDGTEIGGIVGRHIAGTRTTAGTGPKTAIRNAYSQVMIQAASRTGNGGIIGGPNQATAGIIEKSLAYAQGMCNGVAGFQNYLGTVTNVSQMLSEGVGQSQAAGITTITEITQNTMTALGLPADAWECYQASQNAEASPTVLAQMDGYRADRTNAYQNLSRLAYAQDSQELVKAGNALTDQDLIRKQIKEIYPVNNKGDYVAGLVSGEEDTLTKILIEFTDGTRKEVPLTYAFTADDLIAVYRSAQSGITYHFDKYVASLDEAMKTELLHTAQSYVYSTDLDPLTSMKDRRQYKDYYEETTADQLEELITLQMISQEDYPFYAEDEALRAELKEKLIRALPELVYTYNYIHKWYDFEIGSLNPAKLLCFDGEKLAESLTQEMLVRSVVDGDRSDTNQTQLFFEKYIMPRTEEGLAEVLEDLMSVAGYADPNEWFKESFDGILREQNVLGVEDPSGLSYRIWDNMTRLASGKSILLPVLSAPQEDMILVSAPSQVFLSTINRYHSSNTSQARAAMEKTLDTFCQWLGTYLGSLVNLVPGAKEELNSRVIINYDTVREFVSSAYPEPGSKENPIGQQDGVSQEPVFKWVNEAVRKWGNVVSAAYTYDGSEIFYVDVALFDGYLGFRIFTHENTHAQDGSLLYMGNQRRTGAGAEYHADGVFAQEFRNDTMTFNLTQEIDPKEDIVVNFSPERINTPEKLQDYYKHMFDISYVLDYLIAQAFLKLDPSEQAKVVSQSYGASYRRPTAAELQAMKLTCIEDLIYNKLSIISQAPSGTLDGYYVETFWNIKWYQPHSSSGVNDVASFKGFSHEMLGYAGYEDGFVTWLSGKSQSDLDALRKITGDETMTFNQYKENRYHEVQEKLDQIPWFDADAVIDQFVDALKKEGGLNVYRNTTELKKIYYHTIKRATNDFTNGNIYEMAEAQEVDSAEALMEALQAGGPAYIKLTAHIDLGGLSHQNGYYFENFSGIFDGNGYEIYGQEAPLFHKVTFGSFSDMRFDVSSIQSNGGSAILANHVSNILIDGLQYNKAAGVPLLTNSSPIGLIYKEYNVIGDGESYVSPRNQ